MLSIKDAYLAAFKQVTAVKVPDSTISGSTAAPSLSHALASDDIGDLGSNALDFSQSDVKALSYLRENFSAVDTTKDERLDLDELSDASKQVDDETAKGLKHLMEPTIFDNAEYIDTDGDTSSRGVDMTQGVNKALRLALDSRLDQDLVSYEAQGIGQKDLDEIDSKFQGKLTPSFVDIGLAPFQGRLPEADEPSSCGLVAAISVANAMGKRYSFEHVKKLAVDKGLWDAQAGMHGPEKEKELLELLGVPMDIEQVSKPSSLKIEWLKKIIGGREETKLDTEKIKLSVQNGKPVILSTGGHYFLLERYDEKTNKFYVGNSARIVDKPVWMSLDDINNTRAGRVRNALYVK